MAGCFCSGLLASGRGGEWRPIELEAGLLALDTLWWTECAMIIYLVLPVVVLACLLLAYALAQDARVVPNRLFALYTAVVALQNIAT